VSEDDEALRQKILDSYKVVCICNKIRKGTIEKAIRSGASTIADVKRMTRAGTGPCGTQSGRGGITRCDPIVREMLAKAR
jgi:NAD(P)H-nitrite reductase large subunit